MTKSVATVRPMEGDGAPADHGKRPDLKWLPVDRLSVDHRYQRTLESKRSVKLVDNIAERFKWFAFQAILATADGKGGWLVIDGQHRVEAARRVGELEVPAVVVEAASLAEQAAAFVRANIDRVAVNPFQLHRAAVAGGDPAARAVDRLCKKVGIEIPPYQIPADKLKPGQTIALATIAKLPQRFGDKLALQALTIVAEAYRETAGALRAPVIQAVAMLLSEAVLEGRDVAEPLRAHLAKTDPKKLEIAGISRKSGSGGTEAAALVYLLKRAIGGGTKLPVAGGAFFNAPTRDQLMGRR